MTNEQHPTSGLKRLVRGASRVLRMDKHARSTAPLREARKLRQKGKIIAAAPEKSEVPEKKQHGVFVIEDRDQPATDAADVKAQLLAEDDAFLKNVELKDKGDVKMNKKKASWSFIKDRFFSRSKKEEVTKEEPVMDEKEIAQDSFLQRVQSKKTTSVVGTAVDTEESATAEPAADLEEFATGSAKSSPAKEEKPKGKILSAADLRKEAQDAKEATKRLEKEVLEIKAEMKIEKKPAAPEPKKDAPAETPKIKKPVLNKSKNGFQRFLAAFGHIGMGKEKMRFVQNLGTMLNAGLPLIDSLRTLQLETRNKSMRKLMQRILDAVENGSALWRAMDEQSFFSLHAIALIRIGEEAGNLAENVAYLAEQEEKDGALKSKVKMAMIYPTIVLTLMFIIVIGLGMFVLPNLIGVLFSLNVKLPLVTRLVIKFTELFTTYGYIAIPGFIGGFFLMVILAKFSPLRVVFQWAMFRIPGIGRLAREATIARFGVILGGLLRAGVPVIEAMESLVQVTPIVAYKKLYARMLDHITIGDSFAKSFAAIKKSEKLLPPSVQQLVITGEKSGALSEIMLKIADIYDKKASETAQKLPVILEPMLLLFIGGLVGTIAFAIIVPIYSIVGSVGN